MNSIPNNFAVAMGGLADGRPYINTLSDGRRISVTYRGQPYVCSEFGGIWWDTDATAEASGADAAQSWGIGHRPVDETEFFGRLSGLVSALLDDPRMFGYRYRQLSDTFQERNGIYRFDRSRKLDVARLRAIRKRQAAYEAPG